MEGPSLKNFDRRSLRWKIMARVARLWEHRSADQSEFYGLIFVLVDKKNNTLEGLIPADRVAKFKDKVQEGVVYTIEKFDAIKARQKYKAVEHPWRLCFVPRTIVEPVMPQPENFPMLACTLLPFSQLEKRIKENIIMSDVVGRVTSFTEVLAPGAREQRRQIFITDGSQSAVVTLWGEFAYAFDATRVLQRSKHEPIIAIFIAVFVDQYSGMLAFKSTSGTRCHINVNSPEVQAILENTRSMSNEIEIQQSGPSQSKPIEATIAGLAGLDPTDMLDELYVMKIQITEIVSTEDDWCYTACKECWKKLQTENNSYTCSECSVSKPFVRYKIMVHAIDAEQNNTEEAKIAQFIFFGQHGEAIVGKDAQFLSAYSGVQPGNMPREITTLVGKKYIVTVVVNNRSLHVEDYHHYRVKKVEPLPDLATRALLPVDTSHALQQQLSEATSSSAQQGSLYASLSPIKPSTETTSSSTQQDGLVTTPPSANLTTEKDQLPPSSAQKEIQDTSVSFRNKDNPAGDDSSEPKSNKRQAAKELFPPENPKGQKKK